MASSIASAVVCVNSGQFFSGKSMSIEQHCLILQEHIVVILTFQLNISLRRMLGVQDLGKINCLKSGFSIIPSLAPLIFNLHTKQVDIFIDYLTIKFGEYSYYEDAGY